jgi:hypothetical protein
MSRRTLSTIAWLLACATTGPARDPRQSVALALDEATAGRFAALALACVHLEYPNKLAHVMRDDDDVGTPRSLTPAFFGCFDWHSAVHGHWLLAALAQRFPEAPFASRARDALAESLKEEHIAAEVAYIGRADREGFERPYGLAWLLQLCAELRQWDDPQARQWAQTLAPLEALAAERIATWVGKLGFPIRAGEHSQTAFAFGLVWDWAETAGDAKMRDVLAKAARDFYGDDRGCPIAYEPSGHDFLSPCLGEADFMRRVLAPEAFARWLRAALPGIPEDGRPWIAPTTPSDRSDGKLAHLDGLNLSRAWMLEGIAHGLPEGDPRRASLLRTANEHARAGLAAVTGEHYAGGHWLGSFATYLTTRRGVGS